MTMHYIPAYALIVSPYLTATIGYGKSTIYTNDNYTLLKFATLTELHNYVSENSLIICVDDITAHSTPCNIYVSTDGSSRGGLTIDNPVKLEIVFSSKNVISGDIIHLRGGIYTGEFISYIEGSEIAPVIILPYQTEKPIIDGSFTINGKDAIYEGIEIMYSSHVTRTSLEGGLNHTDLPNSRFGVNFGKNIICKRLIIHDLLGVMLKHTATNLKMSGCLSYNIGFIGTTRPDGHGFYIKNLEPTKTFKNCVSINSFRHSVNIWSENGDNADEIDLICNSLINPGAPAQRPYLNDLITGADINGNRPKNVKWINNKLYKCTGNVGHTLGVEHLTMIGNYMPDGITENGNVTYAENSDNTIEKPISGVVLFCDVYEYDNTKGIITIYNWDLENSINCDITGITGISIGDNVRIRSVEDYFNCYQDLIVQPDKTIQINMQSEGKTVATAIGHDFTPATNFPEFGCFMIEKL